MESVNFQSSAGLEEFRGGGGENYSSGGDQVKTLFPPPLKTTGQYNECCKEVQCRLTLGSFLTIQKHTGSCPPQDTPPSFNGKPTRLEQ